MLNTDGKGRASVAVRGLPWATAAVMALLVLFTPTAATAVDVKDGDHVIGTIEVDSYKVQYRDFPNARHDAPRQASDDWGGAYFETSFDFTGCPEGTEPREGLQFRWVQIVYTNVPASNDGRGTAPTTGYVDPWSPTGADPDGPDDDYYEDQKPFYWTDAEWMDPGLGGNPADGNELVFLDGPGRSFDSATDEAVDWQAELNLVCTWDNKVHALGYWTWGFDIPKGIADDMNKAVTLDPDPATWMDGASPGLSKLEDNSEFGAEAHGSWMLTDEACCVPEPTTITLMLVPALLALRGRRRGVALRSAA